jgi:conjugal transfer pilus assembly protein TraE
MRWSVYSSKLQRALKHRNLFVRLAFYELGIILVLIAAVVYAFIHQRTIITPAVVQRSFWVENNQVSESYIAEMTNFFIGLRFNLSPANAGVQRDILLRYTDPRYYTRMKTGLTEEASKLQKQNISMAFYPVDIKVNAKTLQARVSGDVVSTLGQTVLPSKRTTYAITYRYQNGHLWISHFEEVKPDEKK